MTRFFNPPDMTEPRSDYHHGALVSAGTDMLHIAGQLGIAPDGALGEGIEQQARLAFENLVRVLEAAQMGPENLIKIQLFVTEPDFVPAVRAARIEVLGGAKPASTLLVVKGLAAPEYLFEVEGIAAREPDYTVSEGM
jgi:enamine deaminase RidA (YjgF/YER057c/UK114 family)